MNAKDMNLKIGMGVSYGCWTHRYAGTIIGIEISKSGKTATITVQEDTAIRTDGNGMSESQTYRYERNPNGNTKKFKLLKGGWRSGCYTATVGERSAYFDFSF